MKYKSFPQNFWTQFSKALDQELKINSRPVAAFDADGTLWNADLGEAFFKWQIQNSALPNLPPDPWDYYRQEKEADDPSPAYLWLAQINHGQSLQQVQTWAESAVKAQEPLPIFEDVQRLIEWLHNQKVEVYIVTASVKWAVEPGARRLGVDADHVLGVSTRIQDGMVQHQQDGLITYREGKAQALQQKTGRKAFLCCGNTMGDFALLESASQLRLAVGAAPTGHELFDTEERLRQEAQRRGWLSHQF